MLVDLAIDQKWTEAHAELARCEPLVGGQVVCRVDAGLAPGGQPPERGAAATVLQEANSLAGKPARWAGRCSTDCSAAAGDKFSYEEQLAVLDALKSVYARLPEHVQGPRLWGEIRQGLLQNARRDDEQLAVLRELVRDYPDDRITIRVLARRLIDRGRVRGWL